MLSHTIAYIISYYSRASPVASDPLSKASPDGPLKIGSFAPGLGGNTL